PSGRLSETSAYRINSTRCPSGYPCHSECRPLLGLRLRYSVPTRCDDQWICTMRQPSCDRCRTIVSVSKLSTLRPWNEPRVLSRERTDAESAVPPVRLTSGSRVILRRMRVTTAHEPALSSVALPDALPSQECKGCGTSVPPSRKRSSSSSSRISDGLSVRTHASSSLLRLPEMRWEASTRRAI